MAVQAQHPSNVFFFNRNGQEGKDCSLQPQKPHFPFIDGGFETRKRSREVSSVNNIEIATASNSMNPPPPPPPPPQLPQPQVVDLSQLQIHHRHRKPPNSVSTGLHLSSGNRQAQLQHFRNQEMLPPSFPVFSGDFAGEIKRQTDELDRFLQTHEVQLRRTLAENRQRHYRELVCAAEEIVTRRLREKEAEIEKATRRNAELEARAAQLAAEAPVWHVRAVAGEAEAASLQARLQQAITSSRSGGGGDGAMAAEQGDGGGSGGEEAEDAESAYVDPDRVEVGGPSCKICRRRPATVVALPCRHFCLCTECDGAAQACPLCFSSKNSSVEVFFA